MGRKDKKKDDDISDGDAVLGALGLALPDLNIPDQAKPAPATTNAPVGNLGLNFDSSPANPAPRPVAAARPAPAASPVVQDSLMLSFGESAPGAAPAPRPSPTPAPAVARPAATQPAPAPVQPAAKPAATARKLAALPALPKFVAPEEIKLEIGFDAPPVEGKGKIKQITWNLKATDQATNVVTRQSRALNLSPLMAEALDQAKSLRDTIKQHKQEPAPAPQAAPQPRVPAPKPAPATIAQPAPAPRVAAIQATPAPRPAVVSAQPAPAPRPAVVATQPAPASQPAPRPVTRPAPAPAPEAEPLPDLEPVAETPSPQPRARPPIQFEPAAANVPARDIIATPVKTMGGDVLQAQQPIEKHAWQEAKAVMAPSATSRFTAVAQQDFNQGLAASAAARQQPRAAPARQAPSPEPAYEETAPVVQARGGRTCAKCGGTNFREDDDKSKPLSFTPPFLYAKKYTCKNCGTLHGAEVQEPAVAPQPAARPARPSQVAQQQAPAQPRRVVQTTWEETSENVRPSQVRAQQETTSDYGAAGYEEATASEEHAVRATCPSCGGTAFNIVQDKTRPISFGMGGIGAVYAKVKQCKKCGAKFD